MTISIASVARSLAVAAVLSALAACAQDSTGWYHAQAQKDCREKGVEPESAGFATCVREREDAIYLYWMNKMRDWR